MSCANEAEPYAGQRNSRAVVVMRVVVLEDAIRDQVVEVESVPFEIKFSVVGKNFIVLKHNTV